MSPLASRNRGRLAVLVSGHGSNLQAVLDACQAGRLAAEVAVVVSNIPNAYGLTRADNHGVPTVVAEKSQDRRGYDRRLADSIAGYDVDLVVLAGWNRLLSREFLDHFRVINLHPAKPGVFPGLGAIEKAFAGWKQGSVTSGGVMVHFVPDEGIDSGPVIVTEDVPFLANDTLETYSQRVHETEHRLLVEAIDQTLTLAPLDPTIDKPTELQRQQ